MKYLLLVGFILTTNSFSLSVDLIELYRDKGINAVEKMIENELQTKSYWNERFKKDNVSQGYYESLEYLIKCNKDFKDISIYDIKNSKEIMNTSVFVGKNIGDKQKEGDLKTPIGTYSLTQRLHKIDPFYGSLALTTNYPNIYDRSKGKTGHGIWIHGVPKDKKRDEYTKGCIALENNDIEMLDRAISFKNTALQISKGNTEKVSKDDISLLMSSLYKWKDAWKKSDIHKYLSFYDKKFKKANGKNFAYFKEYKKRVFNRHEKKIIKFTNINIIPYPNVEDKKMFKIEMDEYYKTNSHKFNGKKTLYVEIINKKLSILTEG